MSGKAYKTTTGKIIGEKVFKPVDNCSCKFQCTKQIPPEYQKALFKENWVLGESGLQKVSEENVKRRWKRNIDSGRVKNKYRFYSMPCVSAEKLRDTVNHIVTYSDTAGGQNRNQYNAAVMLYAINKLQNIETIDVKYMESGHSYLEQTPCILPLNEPVITEKCTHPPSMIYFKFELSDADFMTLDASRKTKKSKLLCWNTIETQKYPERIPVSVAKKKNLLHLLRTGVIPTEYVAFIEGIPYKKGIRDLVSYQEGSDEED
ncbi:hypothetical protein PR048_006194 [Dryococelus australis]|uniref:Uncharacterized protein n=1 Tax=Dryococelus australis TaxID=614101 RepID=A0ABQ9IAB4_9NEOP|nr:hypothetical protein PR048_006194 [Dryococelus australis]